jgi:folate-binding protein YgfZ
VVTQTLAFTKCGKPKNVKGDGFRCRIRPTHALYNRTYRMASTVFHGNPASQVRETGDVRSEFEALLSGCGFYDLSSRVKIALTGGDRVRWLNGMVTNNIRDLAAGRGVYAFLLNPQGHILGDLYAYNQGESLMIDSDQFQSEKLLATFDHYIIMDDVEVANVSGKLSAIGVTGPKSREVLRAAGFEVPNLEPLQFVDVTRQNVGMTLVRGDNASVESYELWLSPDQVTSIRDALRSAGAMPVCPNALELLRVAAGIPRYGQDIRERDLPQETEQQRALHFSKGCYIGQEIVERIRSRGNVHRKFTGFLMEGKVAIASGAKVVSDEKDVGEVTSVVVLGTTSGERTVALGYSRREVGIPGREVTIGTARATVIQLPLNNVVPGQAEDLLHHSLLHL